MRWLEGRRQRSKPVEERKLCAAEVAVSILHMYPKNLAYSYIWRVSCSDCGLSKKSDMVMVILNRPISEKKAWEKALEASQDEFKLNAGIDVTTAGSGVLVCKRGRRPFRKIPACKFRTSK